MSLLRQMRKTTAALSVAMLVLVASSAFGKINERDIKREAKARKSDIATKYVLLKNGDLFREVNGKDCQITTNVLDFSVSSHPQDVAVIYFIRDENTPNLYVGHNNDRNGDCPKASTKRILSDIKKTHGEYDYSVVPNTNTTIVNVALTRGGDFVAWENNRAVLSLRNVKDYSMHQKYGVKGAPFSSYVAFVLRDDGWVMKVKGEEPSESKWDTSQKYDSLKDFKSENKIK